MARGLPKKYAKMGFKKGWREYKLTKAGKKKTKRKTSRKTTKRKTTRRRGTSRATGGRRVRKLTIPLALAAPAANLIFGKDASGISVMDELQNGRVGPAMDHLVGTLTGYHPAVGFNPDFLKYGLIPLVVGGLVHKFVGGAPLNVNRSLANAGVPILRI